MRILDEIKAAFGSVAEARQAALSGKAEDLARVISFILKEEEWKAQFFINAGGALVFNRERFLELLDNRELDKSYTKFSNKIGLGFKGKRRFLKAQEMIVLDFPYKDCVLKGAQGEDGAKTRELFFNEILAAHEIDALLRPKALCGFELVSSGSEEDVNLLDELKSSSVNLLLKGNNLLALHTLKRRRDICGKVKLIYIDPPYNTGNDSFNYNDRFGHSTWLAFMKSRLEAAREFLRGDGAIFIQCDDSEQAYLKVLCDEIFGRENFVATICWEKKYSPANDAKWLSDNHDFILVYARQKSDWRPNLLARTDEMNARYTNPDNDPRGRWKPGGFSVKTYTAKYDYPVTTPSGKVVHPPSGTCWQTSKENFEKLLQDGRIYFGKNGDSKPQIKQFLSEVQQGVVTKTFWKYDEVGHNQIAKQEIKALFDAPESSAQLFATPKPEALLKRIIEISTNEGDLVMDFFAGSGTTLAVAHKMKRRWVGVEQMGYIEAITKERLKKVVAGEQGGVSKAAGWQGGGGFVYAELAQLNAAFKEKIAGASEGELAGIYAEIEERAFLDYRVDLPEMLKDADFAALPLEEKKQALFDALDGNMDYVLLSDLDNEDLGLDEETRERNRAFFDSELRA